MSRCNATMPTPPFTWIEDANGLRALAEQLPQAAWLALDTESNSAHVYRERVCLLQLNAAGDCYLIDPLALRTEELACLGPALANPDQPLYLHGGEYDVVCMGREFGLQLCGVVDSQQAASLLGWPRTSYGAVVEAICQVELPKAYSQYDWGQRPIDQGALRYALDDVVYLPRVCQELQQQIVAADLEEEFAIACAAVEATEARTLGFDLANMWRLKGIWKLPEATRPMLAALFAWRDRQAAERDQPPGRIINNDLLLALARQAPTNYGQLKRLRLKSWFMQQLGDELIATVKQAKAQPPAVPEPPRQREPEPAEVERERRLKDWRKGEAGRREVPLQVVLPAKALEHLKRYGADNLDAVPQLGRKRIARYGATLRKLC